MAHTIKFSKKSLPTKNDIEKYEEFLPDIEVLRWMSFMISLNLAINLDYSRPNVNYDLIDNVLNLELPNNSFLITSNIEKLESPKELNIKIL